MILDLLHTDINMILMFPNIDYDLTPKSDLLLITDLLHTDIYMILNTDT